FQPPPDPREKVLRRIRHCGPLPVPCHGSILKDRRFPWLCAGTQGLRWLCVITDGLWPDPREQVDKRGS
ncbi:hypothetical protein, partial [Roseomonas mucosa]